jgi:hypothetical protein
LLNIYDKLNQITTKSYQENNNNNDKEDDEPNFNNNTNFELYLKQQEHEYEKCIHLLQTLNEQSKVNI